MSDKFFSKSSNENRLPFAEKKPNILKSCIKKTDVIYQFK